MEPVRPTRRISPVMEAWVERRRRHLAAQLAAADEERWEDLADMMADSDEDDMPPVESLSHEEREHARSLLEEVDLLNRKLAAAKARLTDELAALPPPGEAPGERGGAAGAGTRGGRLDGYV